jgi:hypothetical protein
LAIQIFELPLRVVANASWWPSGDHAGVASTRGVLGQVAARGAAVGVGDPDLRAAAARQS